MGRSKNYEYQKAWRKRYPEKRKQGRKRYFAKHRENPVNQRRSGKRWTRREIRLITAPDRPADLDLSGQIGRSLKAIQTQRSKIRQPRSED